MASSEEVNMHLVSMMSQMMSKFDSKMDFLSDQVTSLGYRMSAMEKNVEQLRGQISDTNAATATTHAAVEQARQHIASLVCFNHEYNITFYGFPAGPDMSLEEAFRRFMSEALHIKQERAMNMPINVQQLGKYSPQDMYPPICVSFVSTKDATTVHGRTKAHGSKLKKSGIWAKWMWHKGVFVKKSY